LLTSSFDARQVPETIALPVVGGNAEYLDWVRSSTTPKP
jgi:uncharacterized protein involved in tolerance to divalent cations